MQGAECFIIVTVLWIFSVCLHEFGHAWAAERGGDYTVRDKGYLNMNPLNYLHPVYSLLMPILFMIMGGIGLPGGAVYINRNLLSSRNWETWVSLAGPLMNILLIVLISTFFIFGLIKNDPTSLPSVSMAFLLELQVSAVLLNLLPVPPLDGFQAIAPWLSLEKREFLYRFSNQSTFILFIVLMYVDPVAKFFWHVVFIITQWCGVDPMTAYAGSQAFHFWAH